MNDWTQSSPELKKLLEDARRDVPSLERLDRVRARLGLSADPAPAPTPAPPTLGPRAWGALAGGVGLVALVALWLLYAPPPSRPSSPAPASAVTPTTEVTTPTAPALDAEATAPPGAPAGAVVLSPPLAPEPDEASSPPPRVARPVASSRHLDAPHEEDPSEAGSTLREEIALLERAIAARDRGDADAARRILAEHAHRFARGVLRPERERLLRELADAPIAPAAGAVDPVRTP